MAVPDRDYTAATRACFHCGAECRADQDACWRCGLWESRKDEYPRIRLTSSDDRTSETATCQECGMPNGWHLSGCRTGLITVQETERFREQLKAASREAAEALRRSSSEHS